MPFDLTVVSSNGVGFPLASTLRLEPPLCELCQRPVDEFMLINDVAVESVSFIILRVLCHGDSLEVEIPKYLYIDLRSTANLIAFMERAKTPLFWRKPKQPEPPKQSAGMTSVEANGKRRMIAFE